MLAKINIIGRLTETPTIRKVNTKDGEKQCMTLKIAVNDKLTGTNEEGKAEGIFYQTTLWGNQAENITPYVNKGDVIAISGHLNVSLYEDKDGYIHPNLEIKRPDVTLLPNPKKEDSPKSGNSLKGKIKPKKKEEPEMEETTEEEIPW